MCCSPLWEGYVKPRGQCRECGEDVDEDGDAIDGCTYSPVVCDTCHHQPCDGSC